MRTITIGLCAHLKADIETLTRYIQKAELELNIRVELKCFGKYKVFLKNYYQDYDILFIVLPFPKLEIEPFLKELHLQYPSVHKVLLSENLFYTPYGYEYGIKNYLRMPLRYEQILKEIKRGMGNESLLNKPYLWISNHKGLFKAYVHKIRYLETGYRRINLYYDDLQLYQIGRLKDFEAILPKDVFFRCSSSYIVNMDYIDKLYPDYNRYSIRLLTGEILPLSRDKNHELRELLQSRNKLKLK